MLIYRIIVKLNDNTIKKYTLRNKEVVQRYKHYLRVQPEVKQVIVTAR